MIMAVAPAYAADQKDPAIEQAKADYRTYLKGLKELTTEYQKVTGEVKDVIREEGVPVFDEDTGEIRVVDWDTATFGEHDVKESGREVTVRVKLPGVRKDSIRVYLLDQETLVVSAGSFERTIELPTRVLERDYEARYKDGFLTVKLRKLAADRQIAIPVR